MLALGENDKASCELKSDFSKRWIKEKKKARSVITWRSLCDSNTIRSPSDKSYSLTVYNCSLAVKSLKPTNRIVVLIHSLIGLLVT